MKKKLVMIAGDDLRKVHGCNYVISNFVKNKVFFKEVELTNIYSGNQIVDVESNEQVPMGNDVGTVRYKIKRSLRSFLREVITSKISLFAFFKLYVNVIRPSQKSVNKYLLSNKKVDFVLFHDIFSAYYFYKYSGDGVTEKCAVVIHEASDDMAQLFDNTPSLKGRFQNKILRMRDYVYDRIDKIVFLSKAAYDKSNASKEKKCIIYNGIDDRKYNFKYNDTKALNCVCVGSLNGRKGQHLIIEALSELENEYQKKVHLYLVGDGPEKNRLEKEVKKQGLENIITFMGARNDVAIILEDQDVFIMPSLNEGLSIATLEAIRAGLFMILSDTGGNKDVIPANGGYIVEINAEDIRDKIKAVIDSKQISLEQKLNTRSYFEQNFTAQHTISNYEKMFLSI